MSHHLRWWFIPTLRRLIPTLRRNFRGFGFHSYILEGKSAYFRCKYAPIMGSIPTFWRKSVAFLGKVVVKSKPCGKRRRENDRFRPIFLVLKNSTSGIDFSTIYRGFSYFKGFLDIPLYRYILLREVQNTHNTNRLYKTGASCISMRTSFCKTYSVESDLTA